MSTNDTNIKRVKPSDQPQKIWLHMN